MVNVAITTIEDMVEHCRLRLDDLSETDTESEYLWSTVELQHFANEAIREVAERTNCIRDGGKDEDGVTRYPLVAPANSIDVDQRIISIKRVFWEGKTIFPESETFLDQSSDSWRTNTTDDPSQFVLNLSSRELQLVGVPTVDGAITLDVVRRPLAIIATGVPEIPQHLLSDCLDWMCHLAYLKNDADTNDPKKAANYAGEFERKVGPRPTDLRLGMEYRQSGRRRGRLYWY